MYQGLSEQFSDETTSIRWQPHRSPIVWCVHVTCADSVKTASRAHYRQSAQDIHELEEYLHGSGFIWGTIRLCAIKINWKFKIRNRNYRIFVLISSANLFGQCRFTLQVPRSSNCHISYQIFRPFTLNWVNFENQIQRADLEATSAGKTNLTFVINHQTLERL